MTLWNPSVYLEFGSERLRPALDLMAQVPLETPKRIVDLGCGPGNVTALLQQRWPKAEVLGIDSSNEMLAQAKENHPEITWQQGDIAQWESSEPVDLIFSNACLHWLGDHESLFPRLLENLCDGGVLAVQMPNNFAAPTHQVIGDVLGHDHVLCPGFPVQEPEDYYNWLSDRTSRLEIWETRYRHILEGENPVADWTKGAALRPVLEGLNTQAEKEAFETAYRAKILEAYPKARDGKTLLAFQRFFLVAQK
ncbi:Trans-aconitate 2-methyltransferase [Candidatus Terasakiella magnetica]|uniref:Trans-aconitate 2-methyltransferase n=1 Tax=Candidatus Terasakiella magnetica TaxID=1867952 RepID=A0A1C3RGN3_9PROT|nr:methyltransferase domain-containing protein [Candidatus Terasakiella magnetica]SCA56456.1 Trans-aconitate 2-methyltransferase [Candidatus Terasakiella magnetica]